MNVVALSPVKLDALAVQINDEHRAASIAFRDSLHHAQLCGEFLLRAQAQAQMDGLLWEPWVTANLAFGIRQAERYMRFARVARAKPDLLTSGFTLSDALEAVADRRAHPPGSGSVEFYTPPHLIEAARRVLGGIDLDPSSCDSAQQQVQAERYFTHEDDGLSQPWVGRCWINPPYRGAGRFVDKLLAELRAGHVTEAVLLVNSYTELQWFHRAATACAAICFLLDRVTFKRPEDDHLTRSAYGSAVIYFGPNVDEFRAELAPHGLIFVPARGIP
jgi:hypothetical protein